MPDQNVQAITNGQMEAIADQNVQAIPNGQMEATANENALNVLNIIFIDETNNDFEEDSGYGTGNSSVNGSDNSSVNGSDNGSDNSSNYQVEFVINDPTPFVMPDVDLNVCPIHELRVFEFQSLYARQLEEHSISEEQLTEIVSWFTEEQLATNMVNEVFLDVISRL